MNLPPLQRIIDIDSVWDDTDPRVKSFLNKRKQKDGGNKTFIQPTDISEFFNVEQCEKFFMKRVGLKGPDVDVEPHQYKEAYNDISPEFHYSGEKFEDIITDVVNQQNSELIRCGEQHLSQLTKLNEMDQDLFPENVNPRIKDAIYGDIDIPVNTRTTYWLFRRLFLEKVVEQYNADPDVSPVIVEQLPLAGNIGVWPVGGKPDILTISSTEDGVVVHISDLKSTHEEKPHYRIQVACYTILIRKLIREAGIEDDVTLEGGVLTYEDDYTTFNHETLPTFDIEVVESDVNRVLDVDGKFTRLSEETIQGADYSLTSKCQNCPYKEDCYTNAIENGGLELLGMGEGIQKFLMNQGITTLRDLASLFKEANHDTETTPTNYNPLETDISSVEQRDAMLNILDNETMAMTVMNYAQQAQHLLSTIYPEHDYASDTKPGWIKGSGKIPLPDDEPGEKYTVSYERGELIRIYLSVQYDHRYDKVPSIGAVIESTVSDERKTIIETLQIPDDAYNTKTAAGAVSSHEFEMNIYENREEKLMNSVSKKILNGIREISDHMGIKNPFVHFYTYTDKELEWFVDGLKRTDSDEPEVTAVRDIIGMTKYGQHEHDQPIHTAIEPILQHNMTFSSPGTHITTAIDEMYTPTVYDYQTYTVDGEEKNIQSTFYQHLFDAEQNFERKHGVLKFDPTYDGNSSVPYRSIVRRGSQIPLTYLWVGLGKITDVNKHMFSVDDSSERYNHVKTYYYRGTDTNEKIEQTDIEKLVEYLTVATRDIERQITWKNARIMNDKERFDTDSLDTFKTKSTFTTAAQDMLDIEYESNVEDALNRFRKRPWQRTVRGEAIMFRVEEAFDIDGRTLMVNGSLIYDEVEAISNPTKPINNCRLKDTHSSGSGSWIVGNKLNEEFTEVEIRDSPIDSESPQGIISGVQGSLIEYSPHTDGFDVRVQFRNSFAEKSRYESSHRWWEISGRNLNNQKYTSVSRGDVFIIDKQADDITSARASRAINDLNRINDIFTPLINGESVNAVSIGAEDTVDEYLEYLDSMSDIPPNEKQRSFIEDTTSQISVLQGPPGTGKTGGTLAPALVSRSMAYKANNENVLMAVTGTSNKSVDEVLESISERLAEIRSSTEDGSEKFDRLLNSTYPIRIVGSIPDEEDRLDHVGYYSYINSEFGSGEKFPEPTQYMVPLIRRAIRNQFSDGRAHRETKHEHQFIFHTTPSRMMGLINATVEREFVEDDEQFTDYINEYTVFDTIAVDEASMFRIPEFFIPTGFMKEGAQLLIAGDHRQMPPVLQHEWEHEIRRPVNEYLPFVSVLDYLRLLRGEEIKKIETDESVIDGTADIPFYRLNKTYRCHETVADFLKESIYTQDGIDYKSTRTETFTPSSDIDGFAKEILNPQYPLTVIVHDDETSGQINTYEAGMVQEVIESVGETETGIVTPHNAQRGLIQGNINAYAEQVEHDVNAQVDTVERFQGGEKELVVVGTTVSDPSTLSNEEDFILSPNRINVAMSRMKTGLIVIVSRSLLDLIPNTIETYERSYIWKSLWKHASKNELLSVDISEISQKNIGTDVEVSVYGIENIDT